jgi:hypothetical protein
MAKEITTLNKVFEMSGQLKTGLQCLEESKNSGELPEGALAEYELLKQRINELEAKAEERLKQKQ